MLLAFYMLMHEIRIGVSAALLLQVMVTETIKSSGAEDKQNHDDESVVVPSYSIEVANDMV